VLNTVYTNTLPADVLEILHANAQMDDDIIDHLCNYCVTDLLTAMLNHDYAQFLFQLEMAHPAMFDHLVTSLGINPGLPLPDKVNAIQISSSIANTIQLMDNFGHDCNVNKMIFGGIVPPNSPQSAAVLGTPSIQTCLRNFAVDAEWATMMQNYYGGTTLWDKIFTAYPNTQSTYINTIATAQPEAFLYYAMQELNNSTLMQNGVATITSLSVEQWMQAIKLHYGETYYQQVLAHFTGGNEQIWTYSVNEYHIYGSSHLGLITENKLLAHQPVYAGQQR
jgi:hypothetical protein